MKITIISILLLLLAIKLAAFSQDKIKEEPNTRNFRLGISYGAETIICPIQLEYAFINKKVKNKNIYVGIAGGTLLIAPIGYLAIFNGIGFKHFILEHSVARSGLRHSNSAFYTYGTYNPKIGFRYNTLLLKGGPSFIFYEKFSGVKAPFGDVYFNIGFYFEG